MEFVLVGSLHREAVTVRQYWGERWRRGARPFGFRLVIGLLVIALAQVPVVAHLRYYALVVLGDIESGLDLVPDRRAAVRADEG
jgi:hypothetical protein